MQCLTYQPEVWTKRVARSLLFVTTLLLGVAPAYAQGLVEYEFAGIVTDNSGELGIFGPPSSVQVNDVLQVTAGEGPAQYRVSFVGRHGADWDVEVDLDESQETWT